MAGFELDDCAAVTASPADPYRQYRSLREEHPVHLSPNSGAWIVSRHADCAAILRDERFSAALGQARRRREVGLPASMLSSDPPDHSRLRRQAATLFTHERIASLRVRVDVAVEQLLLRVPAGSTFDAITQLAEPVALLSLTSFLGIPAGDIHEFAGLARDAAVNLDPLAAVAASSDGATAAAALAAHLHALLSSGRATDGGGIAVLAELLARGDSEVSVDETVATLCLFVIGGYDPLVHTIGNALHTLTVHPDLRQQLGADDSLLPSAVEELLRWESPIPFTARVCRDGARVAGVEIPAGATLVALLAAANRDPAAFDEPERLDLARRPNPQLAFGSGIHRCIAAPMARAVAECVLGRFVATVPEVTLDIDNVAWRSARVPRGLARLPLRPTAPVG